MSDDNETSQEKLFDYISGLPRLVHKVDRKQGTYVQLGHYLWQAHPEMKVDVKEYEHHEHISLVLKEEVIFETDYVNEAIAFLLGYGERKREK